MTNNEIKETLGKLNELVDVMDKAHARNLLKILISAQVKKSCASFLLLDIRKTAKRLLDELIHAKRVNNYLSRKHMKQMYQILGDYDIYPTCKLCGQPIYIDSESIKHENQSQQMAFSWDHIKPKSLGGSYDLANMQPAHKVCNNKRGINPIPKEKSRKPNVTLHISVKIELNDCCDNQNTRYRQKHFGLRKQDSWCHKQCCQYYR